MVVCRVVFFMGMGCVIQVAPRETTLRGQSTANPRLLWLRIGGTESIERMAWLLVVLG